MTHNLHLLSTERRHPDSTNLDQLSVIEIISLMNEADKTVPQAISNEIYAIEKVVKLAIASLESGGRIIYLGAGTSGRLGILDASEAPPTFGVSHDTIISLIAGGPKAIVNAVEGAEDDESLGREDLKSIDLTNKDIVIGLAASGRTPYVIGGLKYANKVGASTGSITAVKGSEISQYVNAAIEVDTGPEILTGSTRLKAGTAQKLILNMISTISMIKLGKVYQNYMVDLVASNQKLIERSLSILQEITGLSDDDAKASLELAQGNLKAAIIMTLKKTSLKDAEKLLQKYNGKIYKILED